MYGSLFPCRLIREQLLQGDFTVNMRLLQVMVGRVSDTCWQSQTPAGQSQKQEHKVCIQGPASWSTSSLDLS